MKILVTGSAGHLGEALMRTLRASGDAPLGLDIKPSAFTDYVGSVTDRSFVRKCIAGCDAIIHTATLHKPHVSTHSRQAFVDTNITGTLNLLEEAISQGCGTFIYTSTTSTFGDAMRPAAGEPAVWVTETLQAKPKNIYGVSKTSAEDLCELFHRKAGLACIVLKTSRFFLEEDDAPVQRENFDDNNLKVNELLFRRVDIADVVKAHQLALRKAEKIGFDRFIISGMTPLQRSDAYKLAIDAPFVVHKYVPAYLAQYQRRNWKMLPTLDRVYDSTYAQNRLGWTPEFTFEHAIEKLSQDADYRSPLARTIGIKGYHDTEFTDGPYPTDGF
ncbi:MAG: NAD(P)-dependent oxidoreductase [Pseudomonadaceae bacterium]|nr:NAD(P)-dependent oxidoreductase [Pseudomonadaceae bacterium]